MRKVADSLPDTTTIGELYDPAMAVRSRTNASRYFEKLVKRNMRVGKHTREEAERIERSNLGYYAGYCSGTIRARVEKLFLCEHPIFGSIKANGPPTYDRAFALGEELGMKQRPEGACNG